MKRLLFIEVCNGAVDNVEDLTGSNLEQIKQAFLNKLDYVCFDCEEDFIKDFKIEIDELTENDLNKDEFIYGIDGFNEYGEQVGFTLWSKFINCKGE